MKKAVSIFALATAIASTFYGAKNQNPCELLESGMSIPASNTCYPAVTNAQANIIMDNAVDFTGQVSFLYWYVAQDNMNVGTKYGSSNGSVLYRSVTPEFTFQPGFKLGLAMDTKHDEWKIFANYTYMHQSTTNKTNGYSVIAINGDCNILDTTWKMNMDMIDVGLNRAFYESKRITVSPVAAFRTLLIRENLRLERTFSNQYPLQAGVKNGPHVSYPLTFNSKFYSWGVGPAVGANLNLLFDHGFRFEGKASGAICYTRYSDVKVHSYNYNSYESDALEEPIFSESKVSLPNFSAIRPMVEFGMGLGWGTYTAARDYYLDLSLRYDFNVFFSQNQLILDETSASVSYGDLYMQGLTVTGRIDF